MRLRLTAAAEADIREIGDWIATGDPRRAEAFVVELEERCRSLAARPRAYPVVGRYADHELRRARHGRYLILYRIARRSVEVIRVLHGARNIAALLELRSPENGGG